MLFKKSPLCLILLMYMGHWPEQRTSRQKKRKVITGIILEGDLAGGGVNQNVSVSMFMQTPR